GDDATHGRRHSNVSPEVSHGPSHSAVVPNESECRACLRWVTEQSAIAVSGRQRCGLLLGEAALSCRRACAGPLGPASAILTGPPALTRGGCALLALPWGGGATVDPLELVRPPQSPRSGSPASRHCPACTWP